ncbi:MAG: hypothetical protein IJF65_04440 [Clostridia bacterium]|nr:hypothetical protein [Clostridia bacterium]
MIVLCGLPLLTGFRPQALAVCVGIYLFHTCASHHFLPLASPVSHLFSGLWGLVLYGWFLIWCSRMAKYQKES